MPWVSLPTKRTSHRNQKRYFWNTFSNKNSLLLKNISIEFEWKRGNVNIPFSYLSQWKEDVIWIKESCWIPFISIDVFDYVLFLYFFLRTDKTTSFRAFKLLYLILKTYHIFQERGFECRIYKFILNANKEVFWTIENFFFVKRGCLVDSRSPRDKTDFVVTLKKFTYSSCLFYMYKPYCCKSFY